MRDCSKAEGGKSKKVEMSYITFLCIRMYQL